jgi:hypothetical protein
MGDTGPETNDVTSCKINNLRISQNSSGTLSGTLSADSLSKQDKPTVELILSLIEKLTAEERQTLIGILTRQTGGA